MSLTWRVRAATGTDLREYFIDAHTGTVVFDYSDLEDSERRRAAAPACSVIPRRSASAPQRRAVHDARDRLRPPAHQHLRHEGRHQPDDPVSEQHPAARDDRPRDRQRQHLDGRAPRSTRTCTPGGPTTTTSSGINRRGLDNRNIATRQPRASGASRRGRSRSSTSSRISTPTPSTPATASWSTARDCHPTSLLGGQSWDYVSGALDIVAHELTHGVTDYSSSLIYHERVGSAERGVLGHHGHGGRVLFSAAGQREPPRRLLDRRGCRAAGRHPLDGRSARRTAIPITTRGGSPASADNGGVHINSGIANHAFYLAIEGGTNRTSGLSVQGVGAGNREQIERVFYRAFTQMLPANATFAVARARDDPGGAGSVRRQQRRRARHHRRRGRRLGSMTFGSQQ